MFGWRNKEEVAVFFIQTNGPDDALLYPAIVILIILVLSSVITILVQFKPVGSQLSSRHPDRWVSPL